MKGMIIPLSGSVGHLTFQWNPDEITESHEASWVPIVVAGRGVPYMQYTNGEEDLLEFTLRFSSKGDPNFVKSQLDLIKSFRKPSQSLAGMKVPPILQVILGADIRDQYVLTRVRTKKHTYANESLLWYYGDANMTLSKYEA
jgi:hypothetical protein